MTDLNDIIDTFQSVDAQTRLELLLDYANNLPALPQKYVAARDEGLGRVHECQTPVFLFVERDNGHVNIFADVADEAPTVKGFVSIVVDAFSGASADAIAACPADLLDRLGLASVIRMNRALGLHAVLGRIKREAAM
jgi:cysteine desulfuration protein SufE